MKKADAAFEAETTVSVKIGQDNKKVGSEQFLNKLFSWELVTFIMVLNSLFWTNSWLSLKISEFCTYAFNTVEAKLNHSYLSCIRLKLYNITVLIQADI